MRSDGSPNSWLKKGPGEISEIISLHQEEEEAVGRKGGGRRICWRRGNGASSSSSFPSFAISSPGDAHTNERTSVSPPYVRHRQLRLWLSAGASSSSSSSSSSVCAGGVAWRNKEEEEEKVPYRTL